MCSIGRCLTTSQREPPFRRTRRKTIEQLLLSESENLGDDDVGVCEVRWQGNGTRWDRATAWSD